MHMRNDVVQAHPFQNFESLLRIRSSESLNYAHAAHEEDRADPVESNEVRNMIQPVLN
jgi:hypothetical protein